MCHLISSGKIFKQLELMKPVNPSSNGLKVLVTGSSRGIGLAITNKLISRGYQVYATARKAEDIEMLNSLERVRGMKLNLENDDNINDVVASISQDGNLYAIVNNAAVTDRGALMELSASELVKHLKINLIATHQMIKGLFPLLKEAKGRVINVSSISGLMVPSFRGGYNISKWGLEVYSEQLRKELVKIGIKVSLIEPGTVTTEIFDEMFKIYDHRISRSEFFKEELLASKEAVQQWSPHHQKDPKMVADRVLEALTDEEPKLHYIVGDEDEQKYVAIYLIKRAWDIISGFPDDWKKDDFLKLIEEEIGTGS